MRNPIKKFRNANSKFFELTHGQKHERKHRQAQSNIPLQLFQSWGHKNQKLTMSLHLQYSKRVLLSAFYSFKD